MRLDGNKDAGLDGAKSPFPAVLKRHFLWNGATVLPPTRESCGLGYKKSWRGSNCRILTVRKTQSRYQKTLELTDWTNWWGAILSFSLFSLSFFGKNFPRSCRHQENPSVMFWLRFKMFLFVPNTERGHFLPLTLKKSLLTVRLIKHLLCLNQWLLGRVYVCARLSIFIKGQRNQ